MRVPGTAFTGGASRYKVVAAVEEDVESESSPLKPTKQNEKKAAKRAAKGNGPSSRASDGESKTIHAKVVESGGPSGETEEAKTYAAAVQGGPRPPSSPVNQSGPYGPSHGFGNEAWRGPTAPGPAPGGWQTGPPKGGYSRPAGSNQSPGVKGEERPFLGVCNLCHAVGHRAAVCPDVICFSCRQKGHTMRNCLTRSQPPVAVLESCQVCDAPNVTFKTCMRCAPLIEKLGNGQVGEQMK